MGIIPDEAKCLPPPGIINNNSVWLAVIGWSSALIHNAISLRPPLKSGVHRQVLLATIGWFIGYHAQKYVDYAHARLDRDMNVYMKIHPELFQAKEKKTFAEIIEPFHPVR